MIRTSSRRNSASARSVARGVAPATICGSACSSSSAKPCAIRSGQYATSTSRRRSRTRRARRSVTPGNTVLRRTRHCPSRTRSSTRSIERSNACTAGSRNSSTGVPIATMTNSVSGMAASDGTAVSRPVASASGSGRSAPRSRNGIFPARTAATRSPSVSTSVTRAPARVKAIPRGRPTWPHPPTIAIDGSVATLRLGMLHRAAGRRRRDRLIGLRPSVQSPPRADGNGDARELPRKHRCEVFAFPVESPWMGRRQCPAHRAYVLAPEPARLAGRGGCQAAAGIPREEEEAIAMEPEEVSSPHGLALEVHYTRRWHVPDAIAATPQPEAQLGVFEEPRKVSLVESAELPEQGPPDREGRAGHVRDVLFPVVLSVICFAPTPLRRDAVRPEDGPGTLDAAVRKDELAAGGPDVLVLPHRQAELESGVGFRPGIGIQEEQDVTRCARGSEVATSREAQVARRTDDRRTGQCVLHDAHRLIAARIVHHDRLHRRTAEEGDGVAEGSHERGRLEGDRDDRDAGGGGHGAEPGPCTAAGGGSANPERGTAEGMPPRT